MRKARTRRGVRAYGGLMRAREGRQTEVVVDGATFVLAPSQSIDDFQSNVQAALTTAGQFVDFLAEGDHEVSVLVTARSHVLLSQRTFAYDDSDAVMVQNHLGDWDLL